MTMTQITCSPSKYIQGRGEIRRLGEYCSMLGAVSACAIIDPYILSLYQEEIESSFLSEGVALKLLEFRGECSQTQVEDIIKKSASLSVDVILGIGGGKTMDTAKAVSYYSGLPVVIVPTVASTDAPCSSLSVLYTEDGLFDRYLPLRRNPDMVVADVDIIAKAPPRMLAAGIGDALSTYYEARACRISGALTHAGGAGSIAAITLARACLDTLLAEGEEAMRDAAQGTVSPAVEHIVEANIYLSGIGFESGGLAAAHAVHNGLTVLEECRHMLHGEKVAFGTLVQLVLEKAPEEELTGVLAFCRRIGLPVTLEALGLSGVTRDRMMLAAEAACAGDSPIHNLPFPVLPEEVLAAIYAADRAGTLRD